MERIFPLKGQFKVSTVIGRIISLTNGEWVKSLRLPDTKVNYLDGRWKCTMHGAAAISHSKNWLSSYAWFTTHFHVFMYLVFLFCMRFSSCIMLLLLQKINWSNYCSCVLWCCHRLTVPTFHSSFSSSTDSLPIGVSFWTSTELLAKW